MTGPDMTGPELSAVADGVYAVPPAPDRTRYAEGPQRLAAADGDPERDRLARIALGHLVEPGNRELGFLVHGGGPVDALDRLVRGGVSRGLREGAAARLRGRDPYELAARAVGRADRLGVRVITPADEDWPAQLDDLVTISQADGSPIERDTLPPHCLWVNGGWPVAGALDRSVAIVGARAGTAYGKHVATEFGYALAERGWAVVSGGAYGIDAAAHRAAIAAGGITAAVLANGVERPYPVSHSSLFETIGETGLVLSEWPPGSDPHRHRFLIRNRVIAALARGTVMVEANARSGARFTLRRTRELGRVAFAVPGPITSALSVGCHEDLRLPDTMLAASVAHVIEAVGRIGEDLTPVPRGVELPHDRLTREQLQVLDGVLARRVRTAEEIAEVVGVSAREARQTLPTLRELGFVAAVPGGYRLPRPSDPG